MSIEFDSIEVVAPGGDPVFDTKYTEDFWYVGDDKTTVVKRSYFTRNVVIPMCFTSLDEITKELVAKLRESGTGPLVLVHQRASQKHPETWGLFMGEYG